MSSIRERGSRLRTLVAAMALVAPSVVITAAATSPASATSVGYSCSAPGGWAAINNPEDPTDGLVRAALVAALERDLTVGLNYSGPATGLQNQSISRTWSMAVTLELENTESFALQVAIDPGAGTSAVNASNATPAPSSRRGNSARKNWFDPA